MATYQFQAVSANLPPSGECTVFADNRELVEFVRRHLIVGLPSTSEVTFSFGPTPPEGIQGRATAIHFETDGIGAPVAIRVFTAGAWRDFYRQVVGSLAWYPITGEPSGWHPCDGTNGTPNLSEETYYEPVPGTVIHRYMGF